LEFCANFKAVAEESKVFFLDAATVAHSGADGLHIDKAGQQALANLVYTKVQKILQ
jgi:lysophospholipase L1-like esterase